MIRPPRPAIALVLTLVATVFAPAAVVLATPEPDPDVPDDWVELEDDTGLLTVSVPPDWTDVVTSPRTARDGTEEPRLGATTDAQAFEEGFDVPGVVMVAKPYDPDTSGVIDASLSAGCSVRSDSRYDDGAFVGLIRHWTSCTDEAGTAEVWVLAVTPVNRSMTLAMLVQITDPGQRDVVAGILGTFNLTHLPDPPPPTTTDTGPATTTGATTGATTPGLPSTTLPPPTAPGPPTTAAPATTSPITTSPDLTTTSPTPTSPPGVSTSVAATAEEPQLVRDDTGSLQIEVPTAWTEIDTAPLVRSDGVELPSIFASTDLERFLPARDDEFLTPGVLYRALPYTDDTEEELLSYGRQGCVDGGVSPYDDDLFSGHMRTFPSCAGTSTRQFIIVANPTDDSFTAVLVIRLTEPGNLELSTLLGSFTYDPSGIAASAIAGG